MENKLFTLENDQISLSVSDKAAEIHHLIFKKTGMDYMWNGDPAFWAGRNPILFPIIGSTWSKDYKINGKTYHMGNHGLLRNAYFTVVKADEKEVVLRQCSDETTLEQYPFHYSFTVTYTIEGNEVHVRYEVTNTGDVDMPYSFGLHPAFRCPIDPAKKFEDYRIEMERSEKVKTYAYGADQFVEERAARQCVELDRAKLAATIIWKDPQSRWVQLTDGEHYARVSLDGYKYAGFWSKPNAPYVCLEPWMGHADLYPNEYHFAQRPGTKILAPGESDVYTSTITIG